MRKTKLITFLIILASVVIGIMLIVFRSVSDNKLLNLPEDEIYMQMSKLETPKLINKINRLEKKDQTIEEKARLLPLFTALIEKADDFSEEQLIELILKKKTLSGIDSAFVKMYTLNEYDSSKLIALLEDSNIADETKEYIISHGDFSAEEFTEIYRKYDGQILVSVIKRLAAIAPEKMVNLVEESISSDYEKMSDGKNRAICLAIAGYYEECPDEEEADAIRDRFAPVLKQIYEQSHSDLVQDEAIYALGRISDNEWLAWIIDNITIDKYTKISVIDRNFKKLKAIVESAKSEGEITSIIEAMKFHPLLDVGESFQLAIEKGTLTESEEINSLITFIEKKGMRAVDKYEINRKLEFSDLRTSKK